MIVSIIDTGISNIASVERAFSRIFASHRIIKSADDVQSADILILPGVGSFGAGMESLHRQNLVPALQAYAKSNRPLMGFCLGMQLLFETSEEFGLHEGLGIFSGHVKALPDSPSEQVPNIGWCDVSVSPNSWALTDVPNGASFYFVHSYHAVCDQSSDVVAKLEYGVHDVTVAVERGNILGLQCHPEKSQDVGLRVLARFVEHAHQANKHSVTL